jgi:hypothetical protein
MIKNKQPSIENYQSVYSVHSRLRAIGTES